MTDCPSRFSLVQWTTGSLSKKTARKLDAHVADCALCQEIVARLKENDKEFAENSKQHLRHVLAALLQKKRDWKPKPFTWFVGPAAGLVAATAVALLVVFPVKKLQEQEEILFKSQLSVQVIGHRGSEQFVVQPGMHLQEGDVLRFVLTTDSAGFVAVLSLNAEGHTSWFYPEYRPDKEINPVQIAGPGQLALPGSIVLDNWQGDEYLLTVFSEKTFDCSLIHREVTRVFKNKGPQALAKDLSKVEVRASILPVHKISTIAP